MKKLMILGAGIYQVPLIKKAQELGVEPVVVSYRGRYPGFGLVDKPIYLDTTDADGVLAAARCEHVDGIVTTGTDVAVRSIGRVCDELGLPGISERAARVVTDKAFMKQAFVDGGVSTSPFEVVASEAKAQKAAAKLGYPVMVKACDVSGSRGVTKVVSPEGLHAAYRAAADVTHVEHIVIEGFVPGVEIGVDGFVRGGKLELFAPHQKFVRHAGDVTIPAGHAFPIKAGEVLCDRIREQLERAVAATGMDMCAVNGDFIVTPDGDVSVIEVGGRCGATCIPELISMHFGIDYYAQMIRAALGEVVALEARDSAPCMAKLLFSDVDGSVGSIDEPGLEAIRAEAGAEISLDVRPGDAVEAVRNGTSRYGQVIMRTGDEGTLDEVLARVARCVKIEQ